MEDAEVGIKSVEVDGGDGVLVAFTDGTWAGYVASELLELRPQREKLSRLESTDSANL